MTRVREIRGVICPIVTPFDIQGQIDYHATSALVDFLIEGGVNGIFVAGSTGEVMYLDHQERKALTEFVIRHVAGRVPVIVHAGTATTAGSVDLTLHARASGAVAVSAITPFYYSYDEETIFRYYLTLAQQAGDFPVFLYIFPEFTRNDISPDLLGRLCEAAPNIVGMKVSNPDLIRFQEYLAVVGNEFVSLYGVDGLMFPALSLGSWGQVSGTANVFPELFQVLFAAFQAGIMEKARQTQQLINRIRAVLNDGRNLAYFKAALALRGIPFGGVRGPMQDLTLAEQTDLRQSLEALDLI